MVRIFYHARQQPHGKASPLSGTERTHEINTNRRDVALSVGVIRKPEQQARLADTRISDKQELEKIVVSVRLELCQHIPRPQHGRSSRPRHKAVC